MTKRWALVTLCGSLLVAVATQYVLVYRKEDTWVGMAGYLVAVILFIGSVTRRPARWSLPQAGFSPVTLLLIAIAVSMVAYASRLAHTWPQGAHNYAYALLFWAGGTGLGATALAGLRPRWPVERSWRGAAKVRLRSWAHRTTAHGRWKEVAFLAFLVLVALALRLVGLADFPDVMSGDEAAMGMEAQKIMRGNRLNPFGTGWTSHANMFFYLEAVTMQLFGQNLFGLRFTAAILGTLGVVVVYLLARESFGRETGWIAAAFVAGWGLALHMSRLGLNNSADVFFGASTLAFLQRGLVRGRRKDFVAGGLSLGASLYFYHGTRLLIPLVLVTLLLCNFERLKRCRHGLLAFAIAALLVAGPLLVFYQQHPNDFMARHSATGLFASDELKTEEQASGKSTPRLLVEHLDRAASAFVYTLDRGYFYKPATPMLYIFSGALFILGMGLAVFRWREIRYQVPLAWIGLTIVFGGWLLKSPPHYQRYLIAAPAVSLLVGRTAVTVLRQVTWSMGWQPKVRRWLAALVAITLLVVNAYYYFGVYAPAGAFRFDRYTEISDRAARRMATLGPDYHTYFVGSTRMQLGAFRFVVQFLAPEASWTDVPDSLPESWDYLHEGQGAHFILIPEREGELATLQEQFPDGQEEKVNANDGGLLFIVYQVESTNVPPLLRKPEDPPE